MTPVDALFAQLKHVRTVEFWLTLVASTVLYLALTAGVNAPGLFAELSHLESTTSNLVTDRRSFVDLLPEEWVRAATDPLVAALKEKVTKQFDLDRALTPRILAKKMVQFAAVKQDQLDWTAPNPPTIEKWREALEQRAYKYFRLTDVAFADAELQRWLSENWQRDSGLGYSILPDAIVLLDVTPKWETQRPTEVNVEVVLGIRVVTTVSEQGATSSSEGLIAKRSFSATGQLSLEGGPSGEVRLAADWFNANYPRIGQRWHELKDQSIREAIAMIRAGVMYW
ncbi:MAG: hypothetical protein HY000_13675 [Planctomycetes bacterium]|nr:hypothetical protein [Planctomycetia bacterium]MBI3464087.1 hypothetical protein [Planctomycetota bacterium]